MSFTDLFTTGEHSRNIGHFASIARMATVDGAISGVEEAMLKRFARKLNISDTDYSKVLKDPSKYPMVPPIGADLRLERMHDLFEMIYADNEIDEEEYDLIKRYAIGLGYTEALAKKLIERSIQIYQGGLDLDDYRYLLNRK